MKLSIIDLRTDRHWRSATGLDQKRFRKLLALLPAAYEQLYGQSIQQRQQECPDQPNLNTYEDLLLFTLFSLKSALSFDLLGFTTGMDGSTAKRNQDMGLLVIKTAFSQSGHLRILARHDQFTRWRLPDVGHHGGRTGQRILVNHRVRVGGCRRFVLD